MFIEITMNKQPFSVGRKRSNCEADLLVRHCSIKVEPTLYQQSRQTGFTLLEMVLVLFLVGLMASATLMLTENVEDQAKYDETKRRMDIMRKAIVGDPTRTVNGGPEISGFVADIGRLPKCVAELLVLGEEIIPPTNPQTYASPCDDTAITVWQQDTDSHVWSGWHGPYIQVLPERNGELRFRDGYGNSDPDTTIDGQNSGWIFNESLGTLSLTSNGVDINSATDDVSATQLVTPADYQVFLGQEWANIDVQFVNLSATANTVAMNSLRIRLNYPVDGFIAGFDQPELDSTSKRDLSAYLSKTFPATNLLLPSITGTVAVLDGYKITLDPAGSLVGNELTLAAGTTVTYQDNAGTPIGQFTVATSCSPNCIMTVPPHDEIDGTSPTVTFFGDGTLTISPQYLAPAVASSLAKPMITVPVGSVVAGDILTLPLGATVTLPTGSSDVIANNKVILNDTTMPITIEVSEAFVLSGNSLTTSSSGDTLLVPPNTVELAANKLQLPPVVILPIGAHSLTVVCDNLGAIYNGECAATDSAHAPISITLPARSNLPTNSSSITWTIQ